MGKVRDIEVDVLRSIGILLIILAHIKAPVIPTVIRCFDVPLMVFVSGLCYSDKTLMGGGTKLLFKKDITSNYTDMVVSRFTVCYRNNYLWAFGSYRIASEFPFISKWKHRLCLDYKSILAYHDRYATSCKTRSKYTTVYDIRNCFCINCRRRTVGKGAELR